MPRGNPRASVQAPPVSRDSPSSTDWVDHKSIGTGIIDFPRLFATVRSIRYRRLFVLELEKPNQLAAIQASQTYVRQLMTG